MAYAKLHISEDFFKELCLKHQQLDLTTQILEAHADRAWIHAHTLGDQRLILIINQLEIFVAIVQNLTDRFGELLETIVVD